MMRELTVCFTGHRKLPFMQLHSIEKRLKDEIISLIEQGYRYFGAGGALGFDTIASQAVLEAKKEYSQVRLILVLPCLSQAERWSDKDKAVYEDIKGQADKVVYISQEYTRDCMFKRNRHLVDGSSVCICYLTEQTGGTAYTVDYAQRCGLRIINIAKRISL